jgi:hypothetical protein
VIFSAFERLKLEEGTYDSTTFNDGVCDVKIRLGGEGISKLPADGV